MGQSEQMCLDLSRLTEEVLQGSRWSEFQSWVCEKLSEGWKTKLPSLYAKCTLLFMNLWEVCSAWRSLRWAANNVAAPASFLTPRWTFTQPQSIAQLSRLY